MAIPSQTEMFQYLLNLMAGYPEFSRGQAKTAVCEKLKLSEAERAQRTDSGAAVYESRVGWAVSWLNDAGYLVRVRRGVYTVTDAGRAVLKERLSLPDFVARLRADRDIRLRGSVQTVLPESEEAAGLDETSPIERLDSAIAEMRDQLSGELMETIMSIEGRAGDTFFEKIVTDLLEKMGYGQGTVTPASNDKGIDGVIKTDPLGFNPILIQAKRYGKDHPIGRPEVQGFAGALGSVSRGAFITTSNFTSGAMDFAKTYPHADIVLIDGKKLTDLLIEYNVGVSVERKILVKRMDQDYFEQ